jgi:hypothetical protein
MFDKKSVNAFKSFLAKTFTTKVLYVICRELEKNFDIYQISNFPKGYALSSMDIVDIATDYFFQRNRFDEFITAALNKKDHLGSNIKHQDLEAFHKSLAAIGIYFNYSKGRIEKVNKYTKDFGIFFDSKEYYMSFLSVDICNSTELVTNNADEAMMELLDGFQQYVMKRVLRYDGRKWEWDGDGGIIGFYENIDGCVVCAVDLLLSIDLFNNIVNPLPVNVDIRVGCHSGWILYKENYQDMGLKVKNIAERLQKHISSVNNITISKEIYQHLYGALRDNFVPEKKGDDQFYVFDRERLMHERD